MIVTLAALLLAQTCLPVELADGRTICARLVEFSTPDAGSAVDAGSAPDGSAPDASVPDTEPVDTQRVIQLAPGQVTPGPIDLNWSLSNVILRGDPDEPAVFRTSGPCLLRDRDVELRNVTFENIRCEATIRGSADTQPCVKWVGNEPTSGLTFRNFGCTGFSTGIIMHPKTSSDRIVGVTLDRVTMTDIWDPDLSRYSTGLFAQAVDGLSVRDSTFDRVGIGTCFSHAIYVQGDSGPAEIARSSFASGGDVELRSGGTVVDSSFRDAPDLLLFGGGSVITPGGVSGLILRSTFSGMKDFDRAYPGCGGTVKGRAIRVENTKSLRIDQVKISDSRSSTSPILLDSTVNGRLIGDVQIGSVDWTGEMPLIERR